MKVQLLSSATGTASAHQFLMSVLVNDELVIDAGCIGFYSPLAAQRRVRHVLLSHTHMDHLASLPIFLDNVYEPGPDCPTVYGSSAVLQAMQQHIFNDALWPDLGRLIPAATPFAEFRELEPEVPIQVGRHRVTPVQLDHVVPTMGFLVEDERSAIAFVSDTAPTEAIWQVANQTPHLKAVFLECSFPTRLEWLAEQSMHLTPRLVGAELQKLHANVPVIVVHIKAAFRDEIERELAALQLPDLQPGVPDKRYEF